MPEETKVPKMNKRRLRAVAKLILEVPKRLDMDDWGWVKRSDAITKEDPPCGTTACIAGWTCLKFDKDTKKGIKDELKREDYVDVAYVTSVRSVAQDLLGLTTEQAHVLFYTESWPDPFRQDYENANSAKKRAKIAAKRIEHMIKTGE